MEIFAREKLPLLLTSEQKQDFFGIYVTKEQHFEISFGHKELLNMLVQKSIKFFKCTISKNTQKQTLECLYDVSQHQSTSNVKRKCSRTITDKNRKRNKNSFDDAITINASKYELFSLTEDNKSKAINHIKNVISNYIIKFLQNINYDEIKKSKMLSNLNNICVQIKNQTAYINCTECNFISKTFTQIEKNDKYKWVLSNFNKHYKIHFKTHFKNNKPENIIKNSSILSFVQSFVNLKSNVREKNDNGQSDDCMPINNDIIIIPYDNIFDITQDNVEAEKLSNSLCSWSSIDNLIQKETKLIEDLSQSSISTSTQFYTKINHIMQVFFWMFPRIFLKAKLLRRQYKGNITIILTKLYSFNKK